MNQALRKNPSEEDPTISEVGYAKFFAWCMTMLRQGGAILLYVAYKEKDHEKLCFGFVDAFDVATNVVTLRCGGAYGPFKIEVKDIRKVANVDKIKYFNLCVARENADHKLWMPVASFAQIIDATTWVSRDGQARNLAQQ